MICRVSLQGHAQAKIPLEKAHKDFAGALKVLRLGMPMLVSSAATMSDGLHIWPQLLTSTVRRFHARCRSGRYMPTAPAASVTFHHFCICEAQRQIGQTSLNEMSSRSPQIIRLTIESCSRDFFGRDNASTLTAAVNFVDLAGSERASESLSAGTRLKEGCHINRRLLTLGTVIRKLSIDAQRVKNLCVAFRNFCEEKNFDGSKPN